MTDADLALLALGRDLKVRGYDFITPSPATHAIVNGRPENAWARTLRDVLGWSRPFRRRDFDADLFSLMQRGGVLMRHEDGWRSQVRVSTLGENLFFHSAFPTSAADAVFFGPDTYRFARAITAHVRHLPSPVHRAIDVCSGAGPGAMVIAGLCPNADILMADINPSALRLSRINAALAGVTGASAVASDLFSGVQATFDLMVSNPPYLVDPSARTYRHGGGPLGAGLSLKLLENALSRLNPGGTLLLYTGSAVVDGADGFRAAAGACLEARGLEWSYAEVDPDVFGEELREAPYTSADRIAAVVLTVFAPR